MKPSFRYSVLFIKKLTIRKVLNALSVYFYYLLSIVFKTTNRGGYPVSLSIEPGTSCNLRCKECPSGQRSFTRPTGQIDVKLFKKIIDESAPFLTNLIIYFQGEPFLHKQFFDIVKYAAIEKKIFTHTSTNGHYLSPDNARKTIESGLDKLIISLDGTTQDVYEKYRVSGNMSKVIEGIKNIIEARTLLKSKTPFIELQFIVFKHNEHQIEDVKQFAKQLGVDKLALKTAQIYNYDSDTDLIPTLDKYSRYRKNDAGTYEIKSTLPNRCKRLWESAVITWDGKMLPCCFDKDAAFQYGNLSSSSMKITDGNSNANEFRKAVLHNRKQFEMCRNCTSGLKKH